MRHYPARAMYDQIEETLTSITMQLRSAIHADAAMAPQVKGQINAASGSLRRASGWARQVANELGSVLLYTLGLAATIEWHLHQFQKCTGTLYELTVNHAAGFDLPEESARTIFEIYCEALSNVARHAGASQVRIALAITAHEVTLVVADNGIGLGEEASRSSRGGIAHMRGHALSQKGLCRFTGARNAGTVITASLPIERAH